MMAIVDPYLAYCFDEAVAEFGATISAELNEVDGKNVADIKAKQERLLKTLLDAEEREEFAMPVATTTRTDEFRDRLEVTDA